MFQDAATPQHPLFDEISYADGSTYEATNCWKDLFTTINKAKTFIYISGWSVWTDTVLVRGEEDFEEIRLGELLLRKVNQSPNFVQKAVTS